MLGNESIGGVTLVNRRFDPSKIYVGDDCATDKLIVSRALAVTDVFMFNDVFADSFRVNFCRAVTTASAFERMGNHVHQNLLFIQRHRQHAKWEREKLTIHRALLPHGGVWIFSRREKFFNLAERGLVLPAKRRGGYLPQGGGVF